MRYTNKSFDDCPWKLTGGGIFISGQDFLCFLALVKATTTSTSLQTSFSVFPSLWQDSLCFPVVELHTSKFIRLPERLYPPEFVPTQQTRRNTRSHDKNAQYAADRPAAKGLPQEVRTGASLCLFHREAGGMYETLDTYSCEKCAGLPPRRRTQAHCERLGGMGNSKRLLRSCA